MPSGDAQRGMMAPRTAPPPGMVQFPARKLVLPSSAVQSGGGYSAVRSQASVSGLQLFSESPESSLLDPQTSPNSGQRLPSELTTFNLRRRPTQGLPAAQPEATLAPKQLQTAHQQVYPPPRASHQDVVADRQLFFHTLTQFHAFFGTELVIPKINGGELDLHLLYCQVTANGGLEQVIKLKKWDHIIMKFGLPTQVSGLPFYFRKHYSSLLHHYEQVYFFRCEGLLVPPPVPLPSPNPISASQLNDQPTPTPGENMEPAKKRRRKTLVPAEIFGADAGKLVGRPVTGAIDGKCEHGYLVTVHVGTENLRGILYHVPSVNNTQQSAALTEPLTDIGVLPSSSNLQLGLPRRKRRGRRLSKRDPNAPRLNRSGYNFYFAEQRSRLKHLGSENAEITRIIGDSWQRLTEQERMPYLQRGQRDKERYRMEKQVYSERASMQPQRKQGEGFLRGFSESLHDSGHAPEELDEAEQDSGDFNDSRHDYHVSLDADIDGGEMNLQNQLYAEYVSGGHLSYSQEQLYYTNANHGQELVGYGSEQTVPLQEDKDYAADHTNDPQNRSQYIPEKILSSQYVLKGADRTQEGRRTEEQTNHIEGEQQYPDNEQNQVNHSNHVQAEQLCHAQGYQDLSNVHASGHEQYVSTQQMEID